MTRPHNVIATFDDGPKAEAALDQLHRSGFAADEVAVLLGDRARGRHFTVHAKHRFPEGAALGGLLGGAFGAVIVGVAAVLGWQLPGLAGFEGEVAGATLAAFVGAGVGGVTGWILGGVIGLGYDQHEAVLTRGDGKHDGHIVVGVQTDTEEQAGAAEQVFARGGATTVAS